MSDAILLERLGKVYVKRRSLREMALRPFARAERVEGLVDVSLAIPRGSIFGLLGPNGAGKTTLLKILSCLILPTCGSARVEGHSVTSDDRPVRRSIGFVTSDERSFYWRLSGEENLLFFARLYGLASAAATRRVRGLLADMELAEVAGRQFMSYSSGMKQRLAICRALLHDPPILCLDEPTRSLDPIAAKHLRQFIARRLHRDGGKTIVLATHNLHEAEEMCGSLAVLDRGRVARAGRLEEITARPGGRDHYLLVLSGGAPPPPDARWTVTVERRDDGTSAIAAEVDRGGPAFSDLLRVLLASGGTIVSCQRREQGLQEVFDLMDETGERR
ncbi:MAG TPA: ABC transporter ATP-binding protein [Patescibacteria group bacterium]|nr:ABC transporter ATP-binding protein [Patescibacteria group bacterium]